MSEQTPEGVPIFDTRQGGYGHVYVIGTDLGQMLEASRFRRRAMSDTTNTKRFVLFFGPHAPEWLRADYPDINMSHAWIEIMAESWSDARNYVQDLFGDSWAHLFPLDEWVPAEDSIQLATLVVGDPFPVYFEDDSEMRDNEAVMSGINMVNRLRDEVIGKGFSDAQKQEAFHDIIHTSIEWQARLLDA